MPGAYHNVMIVQEYIEEETGFGTEKRWHDLFEVKYARLSLTTAEEVEFDQLGHSNISMIAQFPMALNLNLADYRLKDKKTGKFYRPEAPPKVLGTIKKITRVPLKEVEEI